MAEEKDAERRLGERVRLGESIKIYHGDILVGGTKEPGVEKQKKVEDPTDGDIALAAGALAGLLPYVKSETARNALNAVIQWLLKKIGVEDEGGKDQQQ
jgi:hypothetical protein